MKTGLEKPHPQAADFVDRYRAMEAVQGAFWTGTIHGAILVGVGVLLGSVIWSFL